MDKNTSKVSEMYVLEGLGPTGLINQETGMINDNTGMIENSTGLIEENTRMITEVNEVEHTVSGRKKRSRERGKDSKPRNSPLHTMKNLPQFRDKPHEKLDSTFLKQRELTLEAILILEV